MPKRHVLHSIAWEGSSLGGLRHPMQLSGVVRYCLCPSSLDGSVSYGGNTSFHTCDMNVRFVCKPGLLLLFKGTRRRLDRVTSSVPHGQYIRQEGNGVSTSAHPTHTATRRQQGRKGKREETRKPCRTHTHDTRREGQSRELG